MENSIILVPCQLEKQDCLWSVIPPTTEIRCLNCEESLLQSLEVKVVREESLYFQVARFFFVSGKTRNITISVVNALTCLANFSERIPLFCSPPTFLTTRVEVPCRRHDEELIINSRKCRMFIIIPSNHQNMSKNSV